MSVFYRILQAKGKVGNGKYYAKAVHPNTVDLDYIADVIQRNCTLKRSDVKAALTELVEVMRDQLQNSNCVRLDGLGTFRIGLKSKGAESIEKFSGNNITGYRINFLPEYTVTRTSAPTDGGEAKVSRVNNYYMFNGITTKLADNKKKAASTAGGDTKPKDSGSQTGDTTQP